MNDEQLEDELREWFHRGDEPSPPTRLFGFVAGLPGSRRTAVPAWRAIIVRRAVPALVATMLVVVGGIAAFGVLGDRARVAVTPSLPVQASPSAVPAPSAAASRTPAPTASTEPSPAPSNLATSTPIATPLARPLTPTEAAPIIQALLAASHGGAPGDYTILMGTDSGANDLGSAYDYSQPARWLSAKARNDEKGFYGIVSVDLLTGAAIEGLPPPAPSPTPDRIRSRDVALLDVADPGETIRATIIRSTDPAGVAADAPGLGLTIESDGPVPIEVSGAPAAIRRLIADPRLLQVELSEDTRPTRPLADPWPPGTALPKPGRPYPQGFGAIPLRAVGQPMPADAQAALLASLAPHVETIDGRPYDGATLELDCAGPERCYVTFNGWFDAGWGFDQWSVELRAEGATWRAGPMGVRVQRGAMPRAVFREAERLIRADPEARRRLRQALFIGEGAWDPDRPGVITVQYWLPFGAFASGRAGHTAAIEQTELRITVDLATGRVLSYRKNPQG